MTQPTKDGRSGSPDDVFIRLVVRHQNLAALIEGVPVIEVRLDPVEGDVYSLHVQGFEEDLPAAPVDWTPEGFTSPLREVIKNALAASAYGTVDEQAERVVRSIRALLAEDAAGDDSERSSEVRWVLWGPGYWFPRRIKVYRSRWRARLRCRWDRLCLLERWVERETRP